MARQMTDEELRLVENMTEFQKWLSHNAIGRVVRGFLPTFVDKDASRLRVVVDDSLQPRTDGQTIWTSILPGALTGSYTKEDWMLVLQASTAHEAQHINSSNFSDIEEIRNWYAHFMDKKMPAPFAKKVAQDALNIVEDGRIEAIAVKRRRGLFLPFQLLNQIIRDGTEVKERAKNPEGEFSDFWGCVLSYAKTGLFSPGIEVYAGTELESNFLSIQNRIDAGIASRTSADCRKQVEDLLREISPYMESLVQQSQELQSQQGGGQPDEYTSNNESEYNDSDDGDDGPSGGSPLRSPSPTKSGSGNKDSGQSGSEQDKRPDQASEGDRSQSGVGQPLKGNSSQPKGQEKGSGKGGKGKRKRTGTGGDVDDTQNSPGQKADLAGEASPSGNNGPAGKPAGFADTVNEATPLSQEQLDELRDVVARSIDAANQAESAENESPAGDGLDSKALIQIQSYYKGPTPDINQTVLNISGNNPLPPELKTQALTLRRDIERIFTERRKAQRGLRRGSLDVGALWKCGVGDDTLFAKRRNPQAGSCCFYMLIDNSGSTESVAYKSGDSVVRKYQAERMAAAVIEEATYNLVPCKIVLFDLDSDRSNHYIIRAFDEKTKLSRAWNSLMTIGPGGYNADSVHIRIATEELSRRREQKKVLFTLSDGLPSAYGSAELGESEVYSAVRDARRKGIIVIPIMFGTQDFLRQAQDSFERMYERNIIACLPQEITAKLSQIFRLVVAR